MPEFCTCGAHLAPDSLFCHKCGKPQREILEPEPEVVTEAIQAAPVQSAPAPAPVSVELNFHNPIAVRVAATVALFATLPSLILPLAMLFWLGAGFVAVYLYRRRTGAFLNIRAGVRLGWITGVLMSVITIVVYTLWAVPAAASGEMANLLRAQMAKNAADPNMQQEAMRMLQSNTGLAAILLAGLFMAFCFITLLAMAGGALGAKLVGSKH